MSRQGQGPESSKGVTGPRSVANKSSAFSPHAWGSGAPPQGTSAVLGSLTASHFLLHVAAASTSPPLSDLTQSKAQWRRRGCQGKGRADRIQAGLSSASDQQERGGTGSPYSGRPWPGTALCRFNPHVGDGYHALKHRHLCFPDEPADSEGRHLPGKGRRPAAAHPSIARGSRGSSRGRSGEPRAT